MQPIGHVTTRGVYSQQYRVKIQLGTTTGMMLTSFRVAYSTISNVLLMGQF